jgi:hypothetical protein
MPAKCKVIRPWTATDVRILKGLAVQNVDVDKISKKLRRTIPSVTMQASKLGISLIRYEGPNVHCVTQRGSNPG